MTWRNLNTTVIEFHGRDLVWPVIQFEAKRAGGGAGHRLALSLKARVV